MNGFEEVLLEAVGTLLKVNDDTGYPASVMPEPPSAEQYAREVVRHLKLVYEIQ